MTEAKEENPNLQQRLRELEQRLAELQRQTQAGLPARVAELAALQKVMNAANSDLHLDAMLTLTVETVAEVMQADVCSIYLLESHDRLVLRATRGLNPEAVGTLTLRLGEGITGTAAKEGRPIASRDAWADPRFVYVAGLEEEPYRSMLSVPIVLGTYQRLTGVINILTRALKDFSPEEISFLQTIAGQIAIAIENARLYEQTDQRLRQKLHELTTLQRVTSAIASTLDPQRVLKMVVEEAVTISRTDLAAIYLREEEADELRLIAHHGLEASVAPDLRVRLGEGIVGRAVQSGRPLTLADLPPDTPHPTLAAFGEYRSAFCVPLTSRSRTLGGLAVYTKAERSFREDEIQLLLTFADETAIALENARLYEEAQRNLAVKTALLAEMHHRVKNNLQTVAALLSLQARQAQGSEAAFPLQESVARIHSIAAVHDLLSREEIGVTSFRDLIDRVGEVAKGNLAHPQVQVTFMVEGGQVTLHSQEATVFALLLNELITNAITHGFRDCSQGTIRIQVIPLDGQLRVHIQDNGRGLPPDFDLERGMRLGLRIVKTLVETDLEGLFLLKSNGGTTATIEFPWSPPGTR